MKGKNMVRIGLAQTKILWEDVEGNKKRASEFFQKAKENAVELLVFPEMSLTGFSMNVEKTTENWEEQVDFFRQMSDQYKMTVVFGCAAPVMDEDREPAKEKRNYENHLFVAENGKIRMDYRKIHPFTYGQEGEYFQGGKQIITMDWKENVLGAFVCYDLRFPEIFQISSEKSHLIVVIANWPETRIGQWDCLLQARAIENQCFIAGVNRTGEGGGLRYNGHSALYGPRGERMTVLCEEESLLIGDLDFGKTEKLRKDFPVKKDRKEALYSKNSLLCV